MIPGITLDPLGGGRMTVRWNSRPIGTLQRVAASTWAFHGVDGRWVHGPFTDPAQAKVWLTQTYEAAVAGYDTTVPADGVR